MSRRFPAGFSGSKFDLGATVRLTPDTLYWTRAQTPLADLVWSVICDNRRTRIIYAQSSRLWPGPKGFRRQSSFYATPTVIIIKTIIIIWMVSTLYRETDRRRFVCAAHVRDCCRVCVIRSGESVARAPPPIDYVVVTRPSKGAAVDLCASMATLPRRFRAAEIIVVAIRFDVRFYRVTTRVRDTTGTEIVRSFLFFFFIDGKKHQRHFHSFQKLFSGDTVAE